MESQRIDIITPGGNRDSENPHPPSGSEARILEASQSMINGDEIPKPSKDGSTSDAGSSTLLQSTESGGTFPSIAIGETKEDKMQFLKQFITLKGPGGISFAKAVRTVKMAKANYAKFKDVDQNELGETAQRILLRASEILEDAELTSYVKNQQQARDKLGIPKIDSTAMQSSTPKRKLSGEGNTLTRSAKKPNNRKSKPKGNNEPALINPKGKDKRSPAPKVSSGQRGNQLPRQRKGEPAPKISKGNSGQRRDPQPSTSKASVDNPHRMALIDDNEDRGAVDRKTVEKFEMGTILRLTSASKEGDPLSFDASWEKGQRIYDCANVRSKEFLQSCLESMALGDGVRLVPYRDRKNAGHPRGWLWVPLPHIEENKLIDIIDVQNTSLDAKSNLSLIRAGKKKDYGQHFLMKVNRELVPKLQVNGWKIRVGFFNSKIELEGNVVLDEVTQEPRSIRSRDDDSAIPPN